MPLNTAKIKTWEICYLTVAVYLVLLCHTDSDAPLEEQTCESASQRMVKRFVCNCEVILIDELTGVSTYI
jgi:hypothetical protein